MDRRRNEAAGQVDMLHGGLAKKIFVFSLPLIASGILQQSFNAVDVAVIGHYSSKQAMAAVGSNGVIISILVNLFLGIAVGANVVIANYIGQRHAERVRKSISTVSVIALVSGVMLLVLGMSLARTILEWISTPDDVIELAVKYLRIYFLGMPFMMIYNFGSAILRSVGDTKRPFYVLVVATCVNALLDWLLVLRFGMDVDGVAVATVIANMVNAMIIVCILKREPDPFTLNLKSMAVERSDLKRMLQIGVPAGLQGMVFSIANFFIQSSINKFGADAMAGSAAALTYEAYCYYIVSAFCAATIAFTSQNFGAGKHDRCKRVVRICMLMSIVACGLANFIIIWQDKLFLGVFTSNPDVMHYASMRLHCVLAFQSIASTYEISGAYMRGLGYSMTPMLLTIFGTCILRLLWVYMVNSRYNDFEVLLSIYPISWAVTGTAVGTAAWMVQRKVFREHVKSV